MARINHKNFISGRINNLVYRNLDDRQIVQIHPGSIKQTEATKKSGTEFRQCSSWAKQLRDGLYPFLEGLTDSYMYRRLTGEVYNALLQNTALAKGSRNMLNSNLKSLEGFEFNLHSPFEGYFTPNITVEKDANAQLQITIPEFDPKTQMQFPNEASNAELIVVVYATNFDDNTPLIDTFFTLPIKSGVPQTHATQWSSPILPEPCFVMVTAKVLYYSPNKYTGRHYCNSKVLNPARVVFCE